MFITKVAWDARQQQFRLQDPKMAHMFQDGDLYLLVVDFFPQDCDEDGQFIDLDQAEMGGDSVSSEAAVREAQARQRAASRNDRRRCLNCWTVGAHRSCE